MKQGGNSFVNDVFEMKLTDKQKVVVRPDSHTDLDSRSNYIYDKYQHRKWYSGDGYKKLKLREKADSAISNLNSHKKKSAAEEDFFATRTNKGGAGGDSFADVQKDEDDWWKSNTDNTASNDGMKNVKKPGSLRIIRRRNEIEESPTEEATPAGRSLRIRRINLRSKGSASGDDDSRDCSVGQTLLDSRPNGAEEATSTAQGIKSTPIRDFGASSSRLGRTKSFDEVGGSNGPTRSRSRVSQTKRFEDDVSSNRRHRSRSGVRRTKSCEEDLLGTGSNGDPGLRSPSSTRSRGTSKIRSLNKSSNSLHDSQSIGADSADADSTATGVSGFDYDDSSIRRGRRKPRPLSPRPPRESISPRNDGDCGSLMKDDQSQSSRRTTKSSKEDQCQTSVRRERRARSREPKLRGSMPQTPSRDRSHDRSLTSSRSAMTTEAPCHQPMNGAPALVKRVAKDRKSQASSRASRRSQSPRRFSCSPRRNRSTKVVSTIHSELPKLYAADL